MIEIGEKKAACGFRDKAVPKTCATCTHFASDRVLHPWMERSNAAQIGLPEKWRPKLYTVEQHGIEKNLRCTKHGFAVKKMSACNDYSANGGAA